MGNQTAKLLGPLVTELGLVTEEQLLRAQERVVRGLSITPWQALYSDGLLTKAQADTLDLAHKGYIPVETVRATLTPLSQTLPNPSRAQPSQPATGAAFVPETTPRAAESSAPKIKLRPAADKPVVQITLGAPPLKAQPTPVPPDEDSATPTTPIDLANHGESTEPGPGARATVRFGDSSLHIPDREAPVARGPQAQLVGRQLGKYLITGFLGKGACGTVYRGHHTLLNMQVAVKVLDPQLAKSHPEQVQRFRGEARLAFRVNHPNIVRFIDIEEIDDFHIFVMEFVDGISLLELIQINGTISEAKALEVTMGVAEGLDAASSCGIIHRDIKPANIMVTRTKQVKLADLGLAKGLDDDDMSGTRPHVALGTPLYFAPEQAMDASSVDHRSDIYALGATLYHMLTGQTPFTGRSVAELVHKHMSEPLMPPRAIMPGISRQTSDLVIRMMAKLPANRPGTYGELIRELQACVVSLRTEKTTSESKSSSGIARMFGSLLGRNGTNTQS